MKIHSHCIRKFGAACPADVPDRLFNEDWAQKIHGQTLARLNERGGLCVKEMLGNIKKMPFEWIATEDTAADLIELKAIINQHQTNTP